MHLHARRLWKGETYSEYACYSQSEDVARRSFFFASRRADVGRLVSSCQSVRELFASFPIQSILVLDDVRRPPPRSLPLAARRADRMPGFRRHRPPPDLELPRGATVEDVVRLTGTRATSPGRSRLESAPARHILRSPRSATDPSRPRASRLIPPRRPARHASHTPPQRMAPPFPSARRSSPAPASVCSRRAISRRTRWCRGARTAATR